MKEEALGEDLSGLQYGELSCTCGQCSAKEEIEMCPVAVALRDT